MTNNTIIFVVALTFIVVFCFWLEYDSSKEREYIKEQNKKEREYIKEINKIAKKDPRCEKCKYWDIKTKSGNRASCRRYPPTTNILLTRNDHFCGEYVYDWERNDDE